MVARSRKGSESKRDRHMIGLPRGLAEEIKHFIAENPGFGIQNASEFTIRGASDLLRTLRREVNETKIAEAMKAGQPGPFDAILRNRT